MSTTERINTGLKDYNARLSGMVHRFGLPSDLFLNPDHLEIATPTPKDFGDFTRNEVIPYAENPVCGDFEEGLELTTKIKIALPAYPYGINIEWLRVSEKKGDYGKAALVCIGYHTGYLQEVSAKLNARKARPEWREAESETYLRFFSPEDRLEVRFVDVALSSLSKARFFTGQAVAVNTQPNEIQHQ